MKFHEEILGARQRKVLQETAAGLRGQDFYLGGGTALALWLGHRRSVDFDWFTSAPFADPLALARDLRATGLPFRTESVARATLDGRCRGVRLSFFAYPYKLLESPRRWPKYGCRLASLDDLAAMKLTAIAQRGGKKDFIDIYALAVRHRSLGDLLRLYQRKFQVQSLSHLLASLVFFDDADRERMPSLLWRLRWATIKKALRQWVKARA
jgi:hypothetical protein